MERYPCDDPLPGCRYDPPFGDVHHKWFPRHEYTTPTEKKFRNLECNVVRGICRCMHDLEHLKRPPRKPTLEVMRQAIENARSRVAPEPDHWNNWEPDLGDGDVDCGAPLQPPTAEVPPPLHTDNGL